MAVVSSIDRRRRALQESEAALTAYLVEREREELLAIRKARARRIARDRRTWGVLTLVACATTALVTAMLTPAERAWLDAYHQRVRSDLAGLVDGETAAWLAAATAPLAA